MFDNVPAELRVNAVNLARCFFFDHGHELAEAAAQICGPTGEARVIACALQLEAASAITGRLRCSMDAILRILSLEGFQGEDEFNFALGSGLDPASREVERICLLTDLYSALLKEIDEASDANHGNQINPIAA